jgi:uncharacterized protein YdiU (UPF0061 family)
MNPTSSHDASLRLLEALTFERRFLDALPGDPTPSRARKQVRGIVHSRVEATPVARPHVVATSPEVARLLGIDPESLRTERSAQVFAGNALLDGMAPYASCYGGHQFGHWAGQLGDGRAMTLGELQASNGTRWELQLKGAGPTPYSRSADGRAVMRSSVREFLCSEAMHHLGVPTTRALTLVGTGDEVVRDILYRGDPRPEPGAVVCRVAPSFLRFGHWEILAFRDEPVLMRALTEFTIRTHFPELLVARGLGPSDAIDGETVGDWAVEVAERTARMVAEWMRVGFVHGVMNTDNMSVLGLTIDYGPYGWLEGFDLDWTPNTTDAEGRRYAYGKQPRVALWNVARFLSALLPLAPRERLEGAVKSFERAFDEAHAAHCAHKLGLAALADDGDRTLASDLVALLGAVETDMTLFYRGLARVPIARDAAIAERLAPIETAFYSPDAVPVAHRHAFAAWLDRWAGRSRVEDPEARLERMLRANPKYVARNYLAQLAIDDAERGDGAKVERLLDVLRRPYDEQPEREAEYAQKRPEWARHRPGCSMLSCSS